MQTDSCFVAEQSTGKAASQITTTMSMISGTATALARESGRLNMSEDIGGPERRDILAEANRLRGYANELLDVVADLERMIEATARIASAQKGAKS